MSVNADKVLIVEDSVELAEIILAVLDAMSLEGHHATHGTKAIQIIQEHDPDLILLDLGLPDMSGWKILEEIKGADGSFRVPVVVITAHDDPANRLIGKLQEVSAYLVKPFTPDEVEDIIRLALH
ncbi:MAG: response regulator [Anaerolineae bacterium]|nr:response regulator [Anaerolineae bacterium]